MDERTVGYIQGRFGDYYRRETVPSPPSSSAREWGYIPWSTSEETRMVRHQSTAELGQPESFLHRVRPRHVYYSAGQYDSPSAEPMGAKGWAGSDLIFDLDADHLPGIDPAETKYSEMLAACKDELFSLLDLLERDFGFDPSAIVFSGGRGYHVHIRSEEVQSLSRAARREIVEYIRGSEVTSESITRIRHLSRPDGRPIEQRQLQFEGGWGRRVYEQLLQELDEIRNLNQEEAQKRLEAYERIGAERATAILEAIERRFEELESGNIDIHPAMHSLLGAFVDKAIQSQRAAIDEPVTTDINRLIRLPGSLHGGSGLLVRSLTRDELDEFEPLVDAIPAVFQSQKIRIEILEPTESEVGGENRTFSPGVTVVPEYVGIHLIATGDALKAPEELSF